VIRANTVILACGTLETPLILKENGIALPAAGRNLTVHPAVAAFGRTNEDQRPWQSIPQGYGIEDHGLEGIRFEGATTPPHLFGAAMPLTGDTLAEWMADFSRIAQFGFMLTDVDRGRVFRSPGGVPTLRYPVSEESQRRISEAVGVLTELMLRAGATEIVTSATGKEIVRTLADARALRERTRLPAGSVLIGFHPLGTCAMGADRSRSVVDFDHRVHGTENLFVVDGSVVPTPLGVNPQMTIMALALRAAEKIAPAIDSG
jgi:hypothetical protein